MKGLIVVLAGLLLSACGSPPRVDEARVDRMLDLELPLSSEKAAAVYRLPNPFYLGVHFKPQRNVKGISPVGWDWLEKDKSQIFRVLTRLQKLGVLRGYTELRPGSGSVSDIQSAARTADVDAILLLHGVGDVDAGRNRAARLYPLLLTTLFVPGDEVKSVFRAGASVWDKSYEQALFSVSELGDKESSTPMWFVNEEEALSTARNRAIRKLRSTLYKGFIKLAFGEKPPQD